MVCSFIEGVPIARKLNALGVSAFVGFETILPKCNQPCKNATGFFKTETGLSRKETRFLGGCNQPLSFY